MSVRKPGPSLSRPAVRSLDDPKARRSRPHRCLKGMARKGGSHPERLSRGQPSRPALGPRPTTPRPLSSRSVASPPSADTDVEPGSAMQPAAIRRPAAGAPSLMETFTGTARRAVHRPRGPKRACSEGRISADLRLVRRTASARPQYFTARSSQLALRDRSIPRAASSE